MTAKRIASSSSSSSSSSTAAAAAVAVALVLVVSIQEASSLPALSGESFSPPPSSMDSSPFRFLPFGEEGNQLLFRAFPDLAKFRFRDRRDLDRIIARLTAQSLSANDEESAYRLVSALKYLEEILQHQLQQQQQQQDDLDLAAGVRGRTMSKKADEFLKIRPQRENRRYLLWRKITGK